MSSKNDPIGVFDSGVGGISVLREMLKVLPCERFVFLGDSKNAPYGTKSVEEVKKLSFANMETLMRYGVKAAAIACNTATSAAVRDIRASFPEMPVVGIEPALKPAVERFPGGHIAVLATPMTIRNSKFCNLLERFRDRADIEPVPCPGLMEYVERGELEGPGLDNYLRQLLFVDEGSKFDALVLGCTHYPFVASAIEKAAGGGAVIFDGAHGTAVELRRRIKAAGLLKEEENKNHWGEIRNSSEKNKGSADKSNSASEGDGMDALSRVTFLTTADDKDSKIELMKKLLLS